MHNKERAWTQTTLSPTTKKQGCLPERLFAAFKPVDEEYEPSELPHAGSAGTQQQYSDEDEQ